jgi:hypothetical protein
MRNQVKNSVRQPIPECNKYDVAMNFIYIYPTHFVQVHGLCLHNQKRYD